MKETLVVLVLLIIIVFSCTAAYALLHPQTAKVIKLNDLDAGQARYLYDTYQKSKQAWEDYQNVIKDRYTKDKDGFDGGFEFSDDFNYIVPSNTYSGPVFVMPYTTTPVPGRLPRAQYQSY